MIGEYIWQCLSKCLSCAGEGVDTDRSSRYIFLIGDYTCWWLKITIGIMTLYVVSVEEEALLMRWSRRWIWRCLRWPKFRLDERSVIAMIYWTGRLVGTAVYDYSQLSTECIDAVRNNYIWPEREFYRERPERLVLHYSWRTFCDAESSGLIWNKLPDVLHYEEYWEMWWLYSATRESWREEILVFMVR